MPYPISNGKGIPIQDETLLLQPFARIFSLIIAIKFHRRKPMNRESKKTPGEFKKKAHILIKSCGNI